MKFIASSGLLLQKLQAVNGAILSKPVIASIENYLFDLVDGKLFITTTDLETFMQESMEVQSTDNIRICIPSKATTDILRALGEQPLNFTFNTENNSIELSTNSGRYKLPGNDAEDYPPAPDFQVLNSFTIPASILLRGINKTLFATGTDDLRPALTGVLFELSENEFNMVATDANRLVKFRREDVKPGFEQKFIIPKKSLQLIKSALQDEDNNVLFEISDQNIRITYNSLTIYARIMDEQFPDYRMVIPSDNNNNMVVPRLEILSAIKRIAIFANQQTHQIKLKIAGSELSIMAEDIEKASEGYETLPCDFDGEDMEIGFNSKYLSEMLGNFECEDVIFKLSVPSRAGLVVPKINEDSEEILMLIMPMMLNNY